MQTDMAKNNSNDGVDSDNEITQDLELLPESALTTSAAAVEIESETATCDLEETEKLPSLGNNGNDSGRLPAIIEDEEPDADAFAELQYELEHLRAVSSGLEKEVQVSEDLVKRLMDELNASQAQQSRTEQLLATYGGELAALKRQLMEKETAVEAADSEPQATPAPENHVGDAEQSAGAEITSETAVVKPSDSETGAELKQVAAANADDDDTEPYPHRALVLRHRGASKKYAVVAGCMKVGSGPDNEIQVNSSFISRHHAEIVTTRTECVIKDLGSTNGIYVNARRVHRHALRNGDAVVLGKHEFEFVEQENQPEGYDSKIPRNSAGA